MLSQIDIYNAVADKIKSKINGCTCYADDVVDSFKVPAVFIKILQTSSAYNKTTDKVVMDIIISVVLEKTAKQSVYMQVQQIIRELFQGGLCVKNRHLKIQSISSGLVSTQGTILQMDLHSRYFDDNEYYDAIQNQIIMAKHVSVHEVER